MEAFYQRFSDVMEEQILNNSVLARAIGTTHTTIASIRKGKTTPNIGIIAGFIQHTGINGHWLLTGEGDKYHTPDEVAPESVKKDLLQAAADLREWAQILEIHGKKGNARP